VNRANEINGLVALMLVKDLRPLPSVEGEGFRSLMAYCEPNYTLPGRKFFTCYLERMLAEIGDRLTSIFATVEFLSLTADIWTSMVNE